MNKASKRKEKNNTKPKASVGKGDYKGKDVQNAVKTKRNKVLKKPRNVSNQRNYNNRNTASGTSKGGNNARSKICAGKLNNIRVGLKYRRSNKAMEVSKQNKKEYENASLDRSNESSLIQPCSLGFQMTKQQFNLGMKVSSDNETNVKKQGDSNLNEFT